MTLGWAWLRSAAAGRVALAAVLAVAAGYQVARPLTLDLGPGLLPSLLARNVYPSEGDFRWTRARSQVVVPDAGPGLAVRVEARVAGWRPPGEPAPRLVLRAGGASRNASPGQGAEVVSFETTTGGGVWDSDLTLTLDSETFVPGGGDSRALGVRLYALRIVPTEPALSLRRPPLRQVACAALALVLAFGLLLRFGVPAGRAAALAMALAVAAGAAYALARVHAALAIPALAAALALTTLAAECTPRAVRTAGQVLAEAVRALASGARVLRQPATYALAVAGALAVGLAYQHALSLEIPVGGGREALYASGFARPATDAGVTFRQATRGAQLDLRDLGGGSPWRITVTAAASRAIAVPLVSVGGREVLARLSPAWSSLELDTPPAPAGWRSGWQLSFPAAAHLAGLRIARVTVTRDKARPSLRVVAAVVGWGLLAALACGAAGLGATPALLVGGTTLAAEAAALAADPVLMIPFSLRLVWIVALGAGLAALLAGVGRVATARGHGLPVPAALAAAALGFVCWLGSMLSPLYRGGNFLFHSNVAEEIWHGAFLAYYLPYPGSMLSHQAQWGNLLVPHPFLYQLLVAPLAALPQPWFHHTQKAVLALFLSMLALTASLLATRVAGARAGGFAGAIGVLLFPSFLLLGLGHLMTLFGCLALSLALAFLTLRFERLNERGSWWGAVALLTICCLSYTASLIFVVFALGLALPFLWQRDRPATRALVGAGLAAGCLAFVLYYASWTWPFLKESVPRLLAGAGSDGGTQGAVANPLWPRVARIPSKLADSYGSALIPLAGLAGLALLTRATSRIFLWSWAAVLVVFSGLDVFFNFLLKHHYATMTPVAVGLGLLLDRLWTRGAWSRWLAVALLAFALALGVRSALDVALGRIP